MDVNQCLKCKFGNIRDGQIYGCNCECPSQHPAIKAYAALRTFECGAFINKIKREFEGHTAKPWVIEPEKGTPYLISGDRQTKIICTFSHNRLTKPEIKVNAPLLAAAPDLLELCRLQHGVLMSIKHAELDRNGEAWKADYDAANTDFKKLVGRE